MDHRFLSPFFTALGTSFVKLVPSAVNTTIRGIAYVSIWVVLWGIISSLVDLLLLQAEVYRGSSFGQVATFTGYGAVCVVLAIRFSHRFLKVPNDDNS